MSRPDRITEFSKLCVHTQTTRPWNLRQCAKNFEAHGISGISVWRHLFEEIKVTEARNVLENHGLEVISLVRGGFFASTLPSVRLKAIDDNLKAIEEASGIGAPLLVLVCGADPAQSQQLSRDQIAEGILKILPEAMASGVKLAIEPLHPMYAADRSAITSMKQANDMVALINSEAVGVAVDVFHLWWDPELEMEIKRCGAMAKLFAYHICDWNSPMNDMLNDRGLMGEGCINLAQIRGWMETAGFTGYHEVEIFSDRYWAMDQLEYLKLIKEAYLKHT